MQSRLGACRRIVRGQRICAKISRPVGARPSVVAKGHASGEWNFSSPKLVQYRVVKDLFKLHDAACQNATTALPSNDPDPMSCGCPAPIALVARNLSARFARRVRPPQGANGVRQSGRPTSTVSWSWRRPNNTRDEHFLFAVNELVLDWGRLVKGRRQRDARGKYGGGRQVPGPGSCFDRALAHESSP